MRKNKKTILSSILLLMFILISGCSTLKYAGQGAAEGAKKDWQAFLKADEWIRKNLW